MVTKVEAVRQVEMTDEQLDEYRLGKFNQIRKVFSFSIWLGELN